MQNVQISDVTNVTKSKILFEFWSMKSSKTQFLTINQLINC